MRDGDVGANQRHMLDSRLVICERQALGQAFLHHPALRFASISTRRNGYICVLGESIEGGPGL